MKCRRCNGELERDEKRDCLRCPVCYPIQEAQPEPEKDMSKYVDVGKKWTEEGIRALIKDELEDWYLQRPSVTAKDVVALTTETGTLPDEEAAVVPTVEQTQLPTKTWRDVAKGMNVSLYDHERKCPRKKVDVLEEIKQKTEAA